MRCRPRVNTFLRHVIKPQPDDVFTGTPPLGDRDLTEVAMHV